MRLDQWRKTEVSADCDCTLYESSIHPVIRFIHDTKIEPTGWVTIKIEEGQTNLFPSCEKEYFTSFNDIKSLKNNGAIIFDSKCFIDKKLVDARL